MKTELEQATTLLAHLPENQLIGRDGCWQFVGRVNARLAYERKDGQPTTDENCRNAQRFGPNLAGMKTRIFETRENALASLALETALERAGHTDGT